MTLREEVEARFDEATRNIRSKLSPPGVLPREGEDPTSVTINEVNQAVVDSLRLMADRIDALEAKLSE